MTSYILLEKIKVEDANCIAGITYGFPAITHFLGFTHALSRKFNEEFGVELTGCAIFSHNYELRSYKKYNEVRFFQCKFPPMTLYGSKYKATKQKRGGADNPASIIEEGKMDLTVSLLLQCQEPLSSVETVKQAYKRLLTKCIYQARLAGGSIQHIKNISFWGDGLDLKKLKRKLLPSFVLIDAQQELKQHFEENQKLELNKEIFDLWTDFFAYKAFAKQKEDGSVEWIRHEKPNPRGWYVPLMIGYKGISPLYEGYEIENNRDPNYPFRFVESVHGIGEWRSSHRIDDIDSLIWKYHIEDEWYLCRQNTLDMQYLENIEQPQPISSTIDPLDF